MKIPLWQLRNMCYSTGGRLVSRPLWKKPVAICENPGCSNELHNSHYMDAGKRVCWDCWQKRTKVSHVSPYTPPYNPTSYQLIGNLQDSDYRIWVGSKTSYETLSMCRRCRDYCYGDKERKAHKEKFPVTCGRYLTDAYKVLLAKTPRRCVVCRQECFTLRWGIPLHHTNSCLDEWKYGRQYHSALQLALQAVGGGMPYEAWRKNTTTGLFLPSGDGDGNEFTDLT